MAKKTNKPSRKAKSLKKPFCITKHNSMLFAYKYHAYDVYKPDHKCLNKSIVNTIITDYEIMLSHYKRLLVARIDLHPNQYSEDNQSITQFLKQLQQLLQAQYQCKVIYHCAREQNTSEIEHYHLEVMLSAHKIKHSYRLQSLIKAMWEMHANGTVSFVENPYCITYRGDKASLKSAIYRSSYLAKEHTKELNGKAKGFLSNKLAPVKDFDPTTDLMLVDPEITFDNNQRKQAFEHFQIANPQFNSQTIRPPKHGWFNPLSHDQQLKACIAARPISLEHLTNPPLTDAKPKYRYKDSLINDQANEVITQHVTVITRLSAHEPKIDHSFFDHLDHQ